MNELSRLTRHLYGKMVHNVHTAHTKRCKYVGAANFYEDASLLGVKMMRKAEDQRGEKTLPPALRSDLASILADVLVAELREQNASNSTVGSRRGVNRKVRNLLKSQGLAPERDRTL